MIPTFENEMIRLRAPQLEDARELLVITPQKRLCERHMNRIQYIFWQIIIISILVSLIGSGSVWAETVPTPSTPDYWPTDGWRTSSPEVQGVDSAKLAAMLEFIQAKRYNLRNILIIRNGYVVLDATLYPYRPGGWHHLASCTKSIMSILIGIAVDQSVIKSVQQPVSDFFPTRTIANQDANKRALTLEHLLTMSAGFQLKDYWQTRAEMTAARDWAQYMLNLPMAHAPGTRFEYSDGASHLLSEILQETTRISALLFAQKYLFLPLGIEAVDWSRDPRQRNIGFNGIRMRPQDLAKIGFLYLHNGQWGGQQIVSSEWIHASTRKQIRTQGMMVGTPWYGYQWWVHDDGSYMMLGGAGQRCLVLPEQNMVVVITGAMTEEQDIPDRLVQQFVLPAVTFSASLPENLDALARLTAIMNSLAEPPLSEPVPPLPETARRISGKTYTFVANSLFWQTFALTFTDGKPEAELRQSLRGTTGTVTIGLDNVFRLTQFGAYLEAYKGVWIKEDAFGLRYQTEDGLFIMDIVLKFQDDTVWGLVHNYVTGTTERLIGRVQQ